MTRRATRDIAICALIALCLGACVSKRPTWVYTMEASDSAVEAALNSDPNYPYVFDSNREMAPVFEPPVNLRPCCAFGKDIGVQLGDLPIPAYKVANVVTAENLGPHVYDAGYGGQGTDEEVEAEENNGIIYTCNGGFIDTAHVRDYADWTVYLAHEFWRHLGQPLTITLPPELGPREIILHPVDVSALETTDRFVLAVTMAEWAAYHLSVWHEIAQWYGYGTFAPLFPEYPSAYSPEDLYSNVLGTKLAAAMIYSLATNSDQVYARNFDIWLKNTVNYLGAVPEEATRAYIRAVDQSWWDSSRRLPDKYVVLRRNYDVSLRQDPQRVPQDLAAAGDTELMPCSYTGQPIALSIEESLFGFDIEDLVTVQVTIDEEHRAGFAFPTEAHRQQSRVTQADFQAIADAAEAHDAEERRGL